ncbi:MAG: PQQ-dependent sugar dehydrogenase [Dehalococcoidia bacterium]
MRLRLALLLAAMTASALFLSACPKPNGYRAVHVYPHIDYARMVALQTMPGDGNFVLAVTKDGVVFRANLDDPGDQPNVFLDIEDRIIEPTGGEEGLLGLALAPDFLASGDFYVYYSAGDPRRTVLSRFSSDTVQADDASEHVLLEIPQPYANHKGGQLVFGPDGYLYLGLGDGGSGGDPRGNGQNTGVLLGKILRLDVSQPDYRIPRDNPFVAGGGRPEIFAYGFRNPWRFSFDRETGALWAADVGQNEWEEVDVVVNGGNYGWNVLEGFACFEPQRNCNQDGKIPPRAVYNHDEGCAIIGGYVYRGGAMPELRGWYVYGDNCSGKVWAVDAGKDTGDPVPLADTGVNIVSFMEDEAGELFLVTFNDAIYQLMRKPE